MRGDFTRLGVSQQYLRTSWPNTNCTMQTDIHACMLEHTTSSSDQITTHVCHIHMLAAMHQVTSYIRTCGNAAQVLLQTNWCRHDEGGIGKCLGEEADKEGVVMMRGGWHDEGQGRQVFSRLRFSFRLCDEVP